MLSRKLSEHKLKKSYRKRAKMETRPSQKQAFRLREVAFFTFAASAGNVPKKLKNGSQNDHQIHQNWSRSGENAVHEDMQKKH